MATQCIDSSNNVSTDDNILDLVYRCLETGQSLDTIHIPHSDVFFVREALRTKFPERSADFNLQYVEDLMRTELGWTDGSYSRKSEDSDEEAWLDGSEQAEEDTFT